MKNNKISDTQAISMLNQMSAIKYTYNNLIKQGINENVAMRLAFDIVRGKISEDEIIKHKEMYEKNYSKNNDS